MKFKVDVSQVRYGSVEVEANSEEEAKMLISGKEIDYYDEEITDMTVEPVVEGKKFVCEVVLEKHFRVEVDGVENPRDAHVKAMLHVLDHEKEMEFVEADVRTEKVEEEKHN